MTGKSKPPIWFWIVSIIALIWNLMGVSAYLSEAYASKDVLEKITNAAKDIIAPTPAWVTAAFAIAVFGGTIGSILLLLRKGLAQTMFIISLLGVIVQNSYYAFLSDQDMNAGPGGYFMVIMIIGFAIALVFLSKKAKSMNWIN